MPSPRYVEFGLTRYYSQRHLVTITSVETVETIGPRLMSRPVMTFTVMWNQLRCTAVCQ